MVLFDRALLISILYRFRNITNALKIRNYMTSNDFEKYFQCTKTVAQFSYRKTRIVGILGG